MKTHKLQLLKGSFDNTINTIQGFKIKTSYSNYHVDDYVKFLESDGKKLTGRFRIVKIKFVLRSSKKNDLLKSECILGF